MRTVRCLKQRALVSIRAGYDRHMAAYQSALPGYMALRKLELQGAIATLQAQLTVKYGPGVLLAQPPVPPVFDRCLEFKPHIQAYQSLIHMLEACSVPEVTLDADDVERIFHDNFPWSETWRRDVIRYRQYHLPPKTRKTKAK